ncbi:MAG TPA: ABC transporter substrate binding protein [Bradyrhizobium sp.]|nr:ABC transporter substrate binding protein [Bradyrhizobium sp.]
MASCSASAANQKTSKVAYLENKIPTPAVDGLLTGLRQLGYVDGQNISLVKQEYAGPSLKEMKEAILAVLPDIDILVVSGTIGGIAAKSATSDIPVVFISVGAPVDIGLVKSLANPGGNMTGITFEAASETYAKRLQLLKEIYAKSLSRCRVGSNRRPKFSICDGIVEKGSPGLKGIDLPDRNKLSCRP